MASNSSASASWTSPGAGITGGYDGNSQTLRIFIVFFSGLAMYNAVELITIIFLSFNRFRGLYFWSLLISTIGIIPYSLGFMLKFMNITTGDSKWLAIVLLTVGWYPMITGQALVLWSRLHLIVTGVKGERILFYTKWMIIIDAIILHIPTTVLTFGSNGDLATDRFEVGYNIMEKIQMIGFFLQEVTLSSIYIAETFRILRTSLQPGTRKTMHQLIFINVVIIILDLGLLGLECASLYILETLLKGIVYSIKLKLEFAILSKLVKFVGGSKPGQDMRKSSVGFITADREMGKDEQDMNIQDFVDLDRVSTDVTHPSRSHRHSDSLPSRRKSSRVAGMDLDYTLARFQHVEDVSTLREGSSRDSLSPGREADV
ncbi:hypothetical protein M409DRAFT_30451 [Zasmidium cellare ATCC 36951]|uniref:DUF7703 domain-containing protein n=1 Tax=Zasmidium cellare ATCC 36951 TaxID=1080233 RepID=A0A6A6BWR7_ZASCE|nr:uncharacterized protein M409DRAFT_30451 [Zasmidium cellare ATCC 36951]KAF2159033.1 hypothetical protein M409DRAFT_30451 [Zasmidium cellare ATCC 36951]